VGAEFAAVPRTADIDTAAAAALNTFRLVTDPVSFMNPPFCAANEGCSPNSF
jgi:hypothetical protein